MLAHEFIRSGIARDSDFTTHALEQEPTSDGRQHALIAQFASSDPTEFARAAEMIAPFCSGIDLNCGCPQSWAMKEGIGCSLMGHPELVGSIISAAKARVGSSKSVSCKIRIHKDLRFAIRRCCSPVINVLTTTAKQYDGYRSFSKPVLTILRSMEGLRVNALASRLIMRPSGGSANILQCL